MAKLSDKLEANRQQVVDYILNEVTAGGTQRVWDSPVSPSIWNGYNEKTQKEYSGANKLILAVASMQRGYDDPRWLTYKQAQDLGYQVKSGSKGVMLEFWKEYPVLQNKVDENGDIIRDAKGLPEKEPMRDDDGNVITNWRGTSFTVFNAKQIDGMEPLTTRVLSEEERNRELETIIEHSEAPIHWDSMDSNAYHYKDDEIHLRPHEHFFSKDLEYATAMHEIGHSTGHPSRLNRPMQGFKQDPKAYAREELIAEFTSAMLNAKYNLPFSEAYKKDNSVAYIQGWHELVKDNPNELFAAVAKAEQSVKYIEEHMLEPYLQKEQEQAQEHVATKEPVQSIGNEKGLFKDLSITFHHGEGLYRNENDELYIGPISHRHTYAMNTTYEGKDAYTLLRDMAMHDKLTYESVRGLYDCPITINVGKDRYNGTLLLGEGVLGDGEKPLSTLFTKTPMGIEASKQHPDIVDALIKEEAQRIEHIPPLSQGIPNPQTQILVHTHGDSYDLIPPHHVLDVELTPTKESYHLLHCEDQGSIPVYELPEGMRQRYEQVKEANKDYHMFSTDVTLTEMVEKRPFKDLSVSIGFAELIPSEINSNEVYIGPLSDNHTYAKRTTYTGKEAYDMLNDLVKADEYRRNTVSTGYDKVDISIRYQDTPLFDDTIHIGSGELSTQHTSSGQLYAANAFKRLSEQRMGTTVLDNVKTEVSKMDSTHTSKDNYDKAIYHIENEQSATTYHWNMLTTEEHMLATAGKVKPFILADEHTHFRTPVVYINDGKAYDGMEADRIAIKTEPSDMVATKNGVPVQTYKVSDFSKASFTYDSEVLQKYKPSDVTLTKKAANKITATKEPEPQKPKTIKRRIVLHQSQSSTKNKGYSR